MTDIVFLGTATALLTVERTNTALAIVDRARGTGLLIDCGGSIYDRLLRAELARNELSDLFITHAHIDHIGSLPSLIESYRLGGRTAPLNIWGLPEVILVARQIVDVFRFELTLNQWPFAVTFHALEPAQPITLSGMRATILRMDHTVPSAGIRLELPEGTLAYTGDTQPVDAIHQLGAGARTLITECTFMQADTQAARAARHMTATEAGQQAAICGVRTLVLVHLGVTNGMSVVTAHMEAATYFDGEIITPHDGECLSLGM